MKPALMLAPWYFYS